MMILSRTKRPLSTGCERRTNERTTNIALTREIRRSGRTCIRTKARSVRLFGLSLSLRESPNERGTNLKLDVEPHHQNLRFNIFSASTTTNYHSAIWRLSSAVLINPNKSRCVEFLSNTRVAVSSQFNWIWTAKMSQQLIGNENRLQALGYKPANRRKPLEALDARGRLLIEYQIFGCPHDWIRQYTRAAPIGEDPGRRVTIQPGWPLTLEEAADALRIKRRNARWISRQPVFQRELAEQLQSLRNGMKARAVLAQGEILDDHGDGAAADRKVRLQAARAILGEDARGRSVNVTVNNGIALQAGLVIRLPSDLPLTPLEKLSETG